MRALRHRDFRLLFIGQSTSSLGDHLVMVAIALYVTKLTGSPTDVGIVLAAQTLPLVLLLLLGGVWADRLPRHRVMLAADVVRGSVHALLAALIFTGVVRVWEIAVIEFAFGSAMAFFQPAYTGLLPQTVPEELVGAARALTETIANLARLVGPALATVLVLALGAGDAFAIDAATFAVSALTLSRLRPRSRGAVAPAVERRASLLENLREGWEEVRSRKWVWVTIYVFTGIVMSINAPWQTLAPTASRIHYGSLAYYGLFCAVMGCGSVAGSLLAIRWRPRHPLAVGMLLVAAWPVQAGLLALGVPAPVEALASFAGGFGFALLIVWWETSLAFHIPPGSLSRVSSFDWMGALAMMPVGFLISGPLGRALGVDAVLGGGAVFGLVLVILGSLPRATRMLETPISAPLVTPGQLEGPSVERVMSV